MAVVMSNSVFFECVIDVGGGGGIWWCNFLKYIVSDVS